MRFARRIPIFLIALLLCTTALMSTGRVVIAAPRTLLDSNDGSVGFSLLSVGATNTKNWTAVADRTAASGATITAGTTYTTTLTNEGTQESPVWKFSCLQGATGNNLDITFNNGQTPKFTLYKGRTYTVSYKVKGTAVINGPALYFINFQLGSSSTNAKISYDAVSAKGVSSSQNVKSSFGDNWGVGLNDDPTVGVTDYKTITYSFTPTLITDTDGAGDYAAVDVNSFRLYFGPSAAQAGEDVWFKDLMITEERPAGIYEIMADISGSGTVKLNDIQIASGNSADIEEGTSLSAELIPAEGYRISSITYGGTAQTISDPMGCTLSLGTVTTDRTLQIVFSKLSRYAISRDIVNSNDGSVGFSLLSVGTTNSKEWVAVADRTTASGSTITTGTTYTTTLTNEGTPESPVWKFSCLQGATGNNVDVTFNNGQTPKFTLYKNRVYTVSYKVKGTAVFTGPALYFINFQLGGTVTNAKISYDAVSTKGVSSSQIGKSTFGDTWNVGLNDNPTVGVGDYKTVTYSFMPTLITDTNGNGDYETVDVNSFRLYFGPSAAQAGEDVWFKDLKITEEREAITPQVKSVSLCGAVMTEGTVTPYVTLDDPDQVASDTTCLWQISTDGSNWSDVAEGSSYTIPNGNENNYIRVGVTPASQVFLITPPQTIYSEKQLIREKRTLPVAQNVTINGSDVLTAVYTYVQPAGAKPEGDSLFVWQYSKNGTDGWTDIPYENQAQYVVSAQYTGLFIRVTVIPTDADGVMGEAVYSNRSIQVSQDLNFYVATDGSAQGNGSLLKPFVTLEQARDAIRFLRNTGVTGNVVVYMRGGEYVRDSVFELEEQDSNVTYTSYPGERAVITGGVRVKNEDIKPVSDEAVLNRVIDPLAREKLMQIDLSDYFNEIPDILDYDYSMNLANNPSDSLFFSQVQVYVNGEALTKSKWPNNIKDELQISTVDGATGTPTTFSYINNTDRESLWSAEAMKDLRIEGHFSWEWCYGTHRVGTLDKNTHTITTEDAVKHAFRNQEKSCTFYFFNLMEEIDQPGESYVDRENKIVYFYPTTDMTGAEVVVPVKETDFLTASGVTDVTVTNIDFTYVRGSVFNVSNAERFVLDGCRLMHFTGRNYLNGQYNTIRNCHFYDGGTGGVYVSGGDRHNLTGGGNLIENNRIDGMNNLKMNYAPALGIDGYGATIRGNEICNSPSFLISLSGNDHLLEYNSIHHGVQWTGDMGAVYAGASATTIGVEIRNNYFYDNFSLYGNSWMQSIFFDDSVVGPYLHDNIFYRGTLPESEGGFRYAVKVGSGSFSHFENNIFVDNPTAVLFENRHTVIDGRQITWWLEHYGKAKDSVFNWFWYSLRDSGFFTDTWKQHYAGTYWEPYLNMFSQEFYYANLANLDPTKEEDYQKLLDYAIEYAPARQNFMNNNVLINLSTNEKANSAGNGLVNNCNGVSTNYFVRNGVNEASDTLFVDYGKDFTLTPEGLETINNEIAFRNIDMSQIGTSGGVDGQRPSVTNAMIGGDNHLGSILEAQYVFADGDRDVEGASQISWYISDTRDGTFTKLESAGGRYLLIDETYKNKYIRYEVTPYDSVNISGETVISETMKVKKHKPGYSGR